MERPPWSELEARLRSEGFRPSRRLGQNFLRDENMLRAIVRDAELAPGEFALEVGPGLGFLTWHLAEAGAELVCVEIDARLIVHARELLAGRSSVRFVEADVLAGKHALEPRVVALLPNSGPWQLVSNLPYSISAPLLALLCDLPNPPRRMTVLVQREVALRIAARPASGDWGPLSVRLQLDYDCSLLRSVPAQLFWPRPQVESSVVRLERKAALRPRAQTRAISALVGRLFQRRRQTLGRVVAELTGERGTALAALSGAGLDPQRRAEDLNLEELAALAATLPPIHPQALEDPAVEPD